VARSPAKPKNAPSALAVSGEAQHRNTQHVDFDRILDAESAARVIDQARAYGTNVRPLEPGANQEAAFIPEPRNQVPSLDFLEKKFGRLGNANEVGEKLAEFNAEKKRPADLANEERLIGGSGGDRRVKASLAAVE